VFKNAKRGVLASALSLCCPLNEEVPQLRRWFAGTGNGKARMGALERKLVRQGTLC
jgi:hypothetical protein